jgi:hypothetical protein
MIRFPPAFWAGLDFWGQYTQSQMPAVGHEPSFTMAQILADERLLSAVLLPVGDVTAVT